MKRFALIILGEEIKIRRFRFQQDWDEARQELLVKSVHCIPLIFEAALRVWMVPDSFNWRL